jgi:plasmid stabilization system protein ParE
MRFRVIVLRGAEADIASAAGWIAQQSPVAAARWLEGIRGAISTLSDMPLRCPPAGDDFGNEVIVRQLFYGRRRNRYRILFAVKNDTVQILLVRHGVRAPIRRCGVGWTVNEGLKSGIGWQVVRYSTTRLRGAFWLHRSPAMPTGPIS